MKEEIDIRIDTETGYLRALKFSNKKLDEVLNEEHIKYLSEHTKDKGAVGRIIEDIIGVKHSSKLLDFTDGELKSFKCKINGEPKETIAITLIGSTLDELLSGKKFEETHLYTKIKNMVLMPMYKEKFNNIHLIKTFTVLHVKLFEEKYKDILNQVKEDFYYIINEMKKLLDSGKMLKTISGKYLQLRVKDSKDKYGNYHSIISKIYNRKVSEKNRAFFFKTDFFKDILKLEDGTK